jgi:hypothetical protein
VVRVDDEPVLRSRALDQWVEERLRHLDRLTTGLTDKLAMRDCGEVVAGGAVTKVSMLDHVKAFELLEISVDRGYVNVWRPAVHARSELVGGPMATGLDKGSHEFSA